MTYFKPTLNLAAVLTLFYGVMALASLQKDHPLQSKATGTVNLVNWQNYRGYGLRNFEKIVPNLIGVNSEHIRKLRVERDYTVDQLPAVKNLLRHSALDSLVILRGNKIIYEHYANGMTSQSLHSCQSSTKSMLNLLVGKAVEEGKLDLNAKVEKYIPSIGNGFKGQTISNVLAMNVKHELDEVAAYAGKGRDLFDKEESSAGWLPSKFTPLTRRQFIASLKAGNANGTNINRTGKYFYASPNTDIGTWVVERATGVSSQQAVRHILHAIGAENTVYMVTDKTGVPIVMGGLIATARDFARYGILLMNGGDGVNHQQVGGGSAFIEKTMKNKKASLGIKNWYYSNSVYVSPYGFGHAGWGGQFLWVDPKSKTVIVVFSGLMGKNAADETYANLLMQLTTQVVAHDRKCK